MRTTAVFFFLLAVNFLTAQITTSSVAEAQTENYRYNGEVNFLGDDVQGYIGHKLYLVPKAESLREYGYMDFVIEYDESDMTYKQKQRNIYQCCDGYNSSYDALQGKYFNVLDVVSQNSYKQYLKLEEVESGDILYYKYNSKFEHTWPFLAVSYFEHCNDKFLNQKVVTRGYNLNGWASKDPMTDAVTGEVIPFESGIIWEVKAVTLEEKYFQLSAKLVNSSGHTVFLAIDKLNNSPYSKYAFLFSDIDKYEGTQEWDLIINEKIQVGMTEEVAELSWGRPKSINRSSGGRAQWVYEDQYLYFENGILTSWN